LVKEDVTVRNRLPTAIFQALTSRLLIAWPAVRIRPGEPNPPF